MTPFILYISTQEQETQGKDSIKAKFFFFLQSFCSIIVKLLQSK
jgi:hypothetical protein